jgi:hypothetical protein
MKINDIIKKKSKNIVRLRIDVYNVNTEGGMILCGEQADISCGLLSPEFC